MGLRDARFLTCVQSSDQDRHETKYSTAEQEWSELEFLHPSRVAKTLVNPRGNPSMSSSQTGNWGNHEAHERVSHMKDWLRGTLLEAIDLTSYLLL